MRTKLKKKTSEKSLMICWSIAIAILTIGLIVFFASKQYESYFGIPFSSLLFTMKLSTEGADLNFIKDMIIEALPKFFISIGFILLISYSFLQTKVSVYVFLGENGRKQFNVRKISGWLALGVSVLFFVASVINADSIIGLSEYYRDLNDTTTVYETYYINPNDVSISPPPAEKEPFVHIS